MPPNEHNIETISFKVGVVSKDLGEIKAVLREMQTAMSKIILIEERQLEAGRALDRAFGEIEALKNRLTLLEREAPANAKATAWIEKIIFAMAGAVGTWAMAKLGFGSAK